MGKVFDIAIFYLLHERPRPHHDSIVRFLGAEILEGAKRWESYGKACLGCPENCFWDKKAIISPLCTLIP